MPEEPEVPVQSLTIYLTRQECTSPESILRSPNSLDNYRISSGRSLIGNLYVQTYPPHPPRWSRFFDGHVDARDLGRVAASAAVLVVKTRGRLFALTFGQGRHLLLPDCWEDRFGLRVVLNSIDENKVRTIDKQMFDAIARHSKEQASKEASARDFGLDVEQDLLRAVTGTPSDEVIGRRMSGIDALSVAVRVRLDQLPQLLRRYLDKHAETRYLRTFPWVDQIAEATNKSLRETLDEELVGRLREGLFTNIWMAVPEVVPWERIAGFKFSLGRRSPEYHDIHLERFLETVPDPALVSKRTFSSKRVSAVDDNGLTLESWSAYRCLYCELDHADQSYVLSGGKWYRISHDFVAQVNEAYSRIPTYPQRLPDYDDESETHYNLRVASSSPATYALMDGRAITHGGGHSSVEFCDLFARRHDIVHVKRYGASRALSHLFAQGTVAGELFQTDADFRRKVDELLPEQHRLGGHDRRPRQDQFRVVFAVISDSAGELTLPFFSRLNMKHACRRLEGLGFRTAKAKVSVAEARRKLARYR